MFYKSSAHVHSYKVCESNAFLSIFINFSVWVQDNFSERLISTEQKEDVPFPCALLIAWASLGVQWVYQKQ